MSEAVAVLIIVCLEGGLAPDQGSVYSKGLQPDCSLQSGWSLVGTVLNNCSPDRLT